MQAVNSPAQNAQAGCSLVEFQGDEGGNEMKRGMMRFVVMLLAVMMIIVNAVPALQQRKATPPADILYLRPLRFRSERRRSSM